MASLFTSPSHSAPRPGSNEEEHIRIMNEALHQNLNDLADVMPPLGEHHNDRRAHVASMFTSPTHSVPSPDSNEEDHFRILGDALHRDIMPPWAFHRGDDIETGAHATMPHIGLEDFNIFDDETLAENRDEGQHTIHYHYHLHSPPSLGTGNA